jgi:hypothetical protein
MEGARNRENVEVCGVYPRSTSCQKCRSSTASNFKPTHVFDGVLVETLVGNLVAGPMMAISRVGTTTRWHAAGKRRIKCARRRPRASSSNGVGAAPGILCHGLTQCSGTIPGD